MCILYSIVNIFHKLELFSVLFDFGVVAGKLGVVVVSDFFWDFLHVRGSVDLLLKFLGKIFELLEALGDARKLQLDVNQANDLDVNRNRLRNEALQAASRDLLVGTEDDRFAALYELRDDVLLLGEDGGNLGIKCLHSDGGPGIRCDVQRCQLRQECLLGVEQFCHFVLDTLCCKAC